ncbi:MAG: flagellar brake protein [Ectothiorhodospiraceae bacterium]|jgi:c-di-GMP-binding flagellar brake protein YcgR|nr:flagellar brake protein [Ectothiorhodospiraceae bacterium]
MNDEQRPAQPFNYESATERISDPQRIAVLLRHLQEARSLLTVTIPDVQGYFISALLKVDAEQLSLFIDELTPPHGNEALRATGVVNVYALLKGVSVHFKTTLEASGEKDGVAFYRMAFPARMHHMQRREHYRVFVGHGKQVPVRIPLRDLGQSDVVEARLLDISMGGVGFTAPLKLRFGDGQVLEDCVIELPSGDTLRCALQVCYSRRDEMHNQLRVGARFANLDGQKERLVQRYVLLLEREELKRNSRI